MAQPILDRVAACLRPNGRLVDCRKVLADAETELAGLDERIAEAERNSTNPSVDVADAEAAWGRAQDFQLLKRRLTRGIAELREAIAAKAAAQQSEERASAYAEAKAARDALVTRWLAFRETYGQFMQLLADTHANDGLLVQVNRLLPAGADRLRSSEIEARGALNDERWPTGGQFRRFTTLEFDNFDRPGFGYSLREAERRAIAETMQRDAAHLAATMAAERARNTPEAIAERQTREAARYRLYELKPERYSGAGRIPVEHRGGKAGVGAEPAQLWMSEEQVSAAKQAGLLVEDVEALGLKVAALPFLETAMR